MQLDKLTSADIKNMSYNELIGLVKETNRTPGGSKSVSYIMQMCGLRPGKYMLDIGTSTGVTALEMAQLSGCNVVGIDINEDSLNTAAERAKQLGISNITTFKKDDATNLSLPDKYFDVVFCGNVTSLVDNRQAALTEYKRVLKDSGFLAAIPMYYVKTPSDKLVSDVSAAIKVNIKPHDKQYWQDFFTQDMFEVFIQKDFKFDYISDEKVEQFCTDILQREHLKLLSSDAFETLKTQYMKYMLLFRDNLSHMGFTIFILKKQNPEIDPELFTSREI